MKKKIIWEVGALFLLNIQLLVGLYYHLYVSKLFTYTMIYVPYFITESSDKPQTASASQPLNSAAERPPLTQQSRVSFAEGTSFQKERSCKEY